MWDFKGLPDGERKPLLDALKRRCGTGGKLVGQEMEIQGDQRKFQKVISRDMDFGSFGLEVENLWILRARNCWQRSAEYRT